MRKRASTPNRFPAPLNDLTAGPTMVGAGKRDDILKGMFTLHIVREGRKGRQFVMFRAGRR